MFTFKLINSSLNSTRLSARHISNGSGRLSGLFKKESQSEETPLDVFDQEEEMDSELRQIQIDKLRNKSQLSPAHRNIVHGEVPYSQSESWVHETLKYKRKLYGLHGSKSNVDPRTCFFTNTELKEKSEYERVAFPKTVLEMIAINEQQKRDKRERIIAREAEIAKNLEKLENWKNDITMRREKKEKDARVAKDRKDRLIEEVRKHFGYTIDPRDDRFKELLEQKEKAQRKALKEGKRLDKESKLMAKIADVKEDKKAEKRKQSEDVDEDENKQ